MKWDRAEPLTSGPVSARGETSTRTAESTGSTWYRQQSASLNVLSMLESLCPSVDSPWLCIFPILVPARTLLTPRFVAVLGMLMSLPSCSVLDSVAVCWLPVF